MRYTHEICEPVFRGLLLQLRCQLRRTEPRRSRSRPLAVPGARPCQLNSLQRHERALCCRGRGVAPRGHAKAVTGAS